jgi:xylulokinase
MRDFLLGLDIGTTAVKGILADTSGCIIADASAENTLRSPKPGWSEQDAEQWWHNTGQVCRCLVEHCTGTHIAAVGVSGMVPTVVLLDADGRLLRPSIQQNDARSHEEIAYFKKQTDTGDIMSRTGSPVTQQSIGPKLVWLRKHEAEVIQCAAHLMGSYDYINYQLTGKFVIEHNWALESGLYDAQRRAWADDLLELSQIGPRLLDEIHEPSDVIGTVTREAAAHTGLREGTPVVAGSADHVASAFAAGLKSPGDLLVKLGGAGDILIVINKFQPDSRLFIDYHVVPGYYLINGCMASSGSIIKWFRTHFAPDSSFDELDAASTTIPPGSEGLVLLPYFLGEKTPIFDPKARGVLFGLSLSHARAHVYRAVLEAISFGFYHHLKVFKDIGLLPSEKVMVTNGGARSQLWRQITADVLGLKLQTLETNAGSSLGAMFVAGKGVGAFREWSDIERFITTGTITIPNRDNHDLYRKQFELYRQLYEVNRPLFQANQ